MSYASPADMVNLFGGREMVAISRPDSIGTPVSVELLNSVIAGGDLSSWTDKERAAGQACLARMQQVLAEVGRLMDSYLGGRYTLPIAPDIIATSPLMGICADIARHMLQDDKSPRQSSERYERAMQWLRDVASGRSILPIATTTPGGSTTGVVEWNTGRAFFGGGYG